MDTRNMHFETIMNTRELNEKLIIAAYQGQLEIAKELIEQKNADVNSHESGPKAPLISAANAGQTKIVEFLIEKGANLDIRAEYGRTALMYAVSYPGKNDHLETANLLIEKGIDVNATDEYEETALMYAIKDHNYQAAVKLIESGAKVNVADKNGDTPLIYAIRHSESINTDKLIQYLINANANVNATNKKGQTPLMLLSSSNAPSLIDLLIKAGANKNDLFCNGKTELMHAVQYNDMVLIKELIQQGVNINTQDQEGQTALMIAVKNGNIELAQFLIKSGANVNIKDNDGCSSLLHACPNEKMMLLLIEAKADINVVSKSHTTALYYATRFGSQKIIDKLLEMNIQENVINAKTKGNIIRDGYTPLGYAVEQAIKGYDQDEKIKYRKIVLQLLTHGANPMIECDGLSAYDILSKHMSNDTEIMMQLLAPFNEKKKMEECSTSITQFTVFKNDSTSAPSSTKQLKKSHHCNIL